MTGYFAQRLAFLATFVVASGLVFEVKQSGAGEPNASPGRDEKGWSEAVDGLRMRLVLEQDDPESWRSVHLALELENVGTATLLVLQPEILPRISKTGQTGYPDDHGCNTVITADWSRHVDITIAHLTKPKATLGMAVDLAPGQRLRVDIDTTPPSRDRQGTAISTKKGRTAGDTSESSPSSPPKPIVVQAAAPFAMHWPDTYRLEATYAVDTMNWISKTGRRWTGKLTSKPISFTVTGER